MNTKKLDVYHYIRLSDLKGPAAYKYLLLSVSVMLIKQQNTALAKINPYLIYSVNTMQCYFTLNDYISVPEN